MQCDFVSLTGDKMAKHLVLNPGHVSSTCRPHGTVVVVIVIQSSVCVC